MTYTHAKTAILVGYIVISTSLHEYVLVLYGGAIEYSVPSSQQNLVYAGQVTWLIPSL